MKLDQTKSKGGGGGWCCETRDVMDFKIIVGVGGFMGKHYRQVILRQHIQAQIVSRLQH